MAVFSITEAMVSWLSSMGYAASSRVPADMPAEFVTVERTGGGAGSYVDHPVVAVQFWAATDAEAEAMANAARAAILTQPKPPGVHSARVNSGPYAFYDEYTGRARYQLVLDVACQLEI